MQYRTDLAMELVDKEDIKGIRQFREEIDDIIIDRIKITDKDGVAYTGKPIGTYVTVSVPSISDSFSAKAENIALLAKEIRELIPKEGLVLVVGLGNTSITPDALGPESVKGILATRHIIDEFKRIEGLDRLRPTAVLAPGVLGQTGIEAADIILSLVEKINPSAVIAIDALASRCLERLGCTVQISDTGISPGAGVGNNRPEINKLTLGVPVIAIGVPTVVDAEIIAAKTPQNNVCPDGKKMMVTPREIDLLISRAAKLISLSINLALHPDYDPHELSDAV